MPERFNPFVLVSTAAGTEKPGITASMCAFRCSSVEVKNDADEMGEYVNLISEDMVFSSLTTEGLLDLVSVRFLAALVSLWRDWDMVGCVGILDLNSWNADLSSVGSRTQQITFTFGGIGGLRMLDFPKLGSVVAGSSTSTAVRRKIGRRA
jgi:hypothetical protein